MPVKILVPYSYRFIPDNDANDEHRYWRNFYQSVADTVEPISWSFHHDHIMSALRKEILRYRGSIKVTKNRVNCLLRFHNEQDYLLFKLKWS